MKIVKKINHDSLWVKAVRKDKTWFKVTVNRSGLNYGDLINNCETAFESIN